MSTGSKRESIVSIPYKLSSKLSKPKKDVVKLLSSNLFPVVGVGASAGGLDAFKRLIKAIPDDSGMAYILVQHLDPAHESILSELLQKVTRIPVQEITDNIHVEADHIYIIPANKLLTATDGVLQLSARPAGKQRNLPIDLFFTSLAEVHQNHAIGVVLSGTASDGTQGLKAIKDHGGITFAQDQESAAYDGMPQSAIDEGVVDFILPPEKIPSQILKLSSVFQQDPVDEEEHAEQIQENGFKQIIALLRIRKGVDFTYYKQPTIRRRITRRIALSSKAGIGDYLVYLKENKSEQDILFQDMLIPVTEFFRDPKVFDALTETVLPVLLKDRPGNDPVRIWVAGSSTGEEAYSLAICFQEYIEAKAPQGRIQVFATDISDPAIAKARSGVYTKNETAGLSSVRLQQFFTRTDDHVRVNKNIRDTCVFANHNYLKDPPFARIDLISCRNSLIYLGPHLQKKALTTFHYALKEKGFLVLGRSETTGQAAELYNTLDRTNKFYTRTAVKGNFLQVLGGRNDDVLKRHVNGVKPKETSKDDFQKSGDEVLLSKFVPPGVIVNEMLDIVQFRGATGTWLEAAPGTPSMNVLKMAREGLAFELRNALHKAKKEKENVVKENIPIDYAGRERLVTIEVMPLPNTIEQYFLILFREVPAASGADTEQITDPGQKSKSDQRYSREILRNKELKKELAQTRDDMRSVTEEQEVAFEELQSNNEELLSSSEELQSLNEELETSKEEVQTSNEELIIINQELFDRNEQLNIARLYAESIVTTIREPLIIITKDLKVKTVNKSFYDKFHGNEDSTVGRSLFELGNDHWDMPGLRKMLEEMRSLKTGIVDFEITHTFPGLGERTICINASQINTQQNEEGSILIAIEDITEKKKMESESIVFTERLEKMVMDRTFSLQEANGELQVSNESLEQFAYVASHDLQEPLRKIMVFSTMLQDKYKKELPEAVQGLVTKIWSSSERMSRLIKELLNFSKIMHSDDAFVRSDLDDILSKVIVDLDLLITESNVVITREPLPVIDAIPFQINQLFYNLISNSIKFAKKDVDPVINITSKSLTLEEAAGYANLNPKLSYCEIEIKDNGIGFKQQFADQIFLIFRRLNTSQPFSGTGIGLALCKKIVTGHHGEISAVSKINEGSTFKILLPLTQ
jgi:two-component system CheB/CheR fusion protein